MFTCKLCLQNYIKKSIRAYKFGRVRFFPVQIEGNYWGGGVLFVGRDLHGYSSRPRPVEFAEVDALPGPEEQFAVFDQQGLGCADQGRFDMEN